MKKNKLLKISIVGKTNAGKSTFINSIVGEKISISNKKINTTEELVLGILNINNVQLIFYDTPGINNLKNLYHNKLKQNLWEGLNQSDIILYIIDVTKYNYIEISKNLIKLHELKKKILIIFNKNDLINNSIILPKIKEIESNNDIESFFSISAQKNKGIKNLIKNILKYSYFSNWVFKNNEISNKDDVYTSNETTRNEVLTLLHKEIPYNLKVENKIFKFLKNGHIKIKQEIKIKNLRYKKIILGKNGDKIKNIRTRSQANMSKIFNTKVHLYINIIKDNAE